jgi:putative ABC transport system substrate-binding protein
MRRRQFITLVGGVATTWPLVSLAQAPPRRPLVAFLAGASSASVLAKTGPAFLTGLHEQGLVEGRDLEIAYSFAEGHLDRLAALARQLVQLKPEVIFAVPTPAALAAKPQGRYRSCAPSSKIQFAWAWLLAKTAQAVTSPAS